MKRIIVLGLALLLACTGAFAQSSKKEKCIDFTLSSPDGKDVTLSKIYPSNKLTMIDFWASWCGPCRRFNPTLVKIYEKYHSKGLEIVGVSLDKDADSWKNAIEKDGLKWIHCSDLQYWKCAPARAYGVEYIPQSVIVDSEGNIVAARLDEEELVKLFEEYLGK
ncbi:MAG: TlpA family protein disulfide reductase [Bacteroidales bacterium]|nr:TlpA family protein disulfide reductase [Bacteroidales bacterium]